MSQVPGLGHVTSYLHSTLFHSPLVGVDKETLATCTEFPTYLPFVSQKLVVPSSYMSRSITISKIFAHHNTRRVILPYFCGLLKIWD